MKILLCIPTLEYGGAERQLCYLAEELTRMGHEIHVALIRRGAHFERMVAAGAIVHEIHTRGHHDPRLFVNLARLMRKLKPDVVQTCNMQMDVAAGAAALLTRTPWVLCELSAAPCYPRGWKSSLRRMLGKRAGAIVSNSRQGDAYWLEVDLRRRYVIVNAVPLAEIDAVETDVPDRQTVLFAGRMDDGKNVGSLIDALSRIANGIDFEVVLCGDGPRRPELEQLAADRGLTKRILFPGYVTNVWQRMKSAAVFVSLSRYEGCPNVVLEAMACGCPLVVSDIPAHREILDEESALFVPCGDAAAAAEAIRKTLSARAAAESRARIARTLTVLWSVETMARGFEAVYADVSGQMLPDLACRKR
jgi:glycosyltransferase involved in cell wall biosynthesis